MLSLSILAAKALAVKTALGRFLNGQAAAALGIAVVVVVVVLGAIWMAGKIESGAVAGWQSKLALSRYVATLRERRLQREADERAAAERELLVEQIRETAAHAASLEQALARAAENPVCFPANIVKELRK